MHGKPNNDTSIKIECIKIRLELLSLFDYYLPFGVEVLQKKGRTAIKGFPSSINFKPIFKKTSFCTAYGN